MSVVAPRTVKDRSLHSIQNLSVDIEGRVFLTPDNGIEAHLSEGRQYFRVLDEDGNPEGFYLRAPEGSAGKYFFLTKPGGDASTVRKQGSTPLPKSRSSFQVSEPWVEGDLPMSPTYAADLPRPSPPSLRAIERTRAGYPGGPYALAFAPVAPGMLLTDRGPTYRFDASTGQRFKVPLPDIEEGFIGVALLLSEPSTDGVNVGTLRMQRFIDYRRGKPPHYVLSGPYRYDARVAPAVNETFIGTPSRPRIRLRRSLYNLKGGPKATRTIGTGNSAVTYTAKAAAESGNDVRVQHVDPTTTGTALSVSASGKDVTVSLATSGERAFRTIGSGAGSILYTADDPGTGGNDIAVEHILPATANASFSISVTGTTITVNLATGSNGERTTTSGYVRDAINNHGGAAPLVNASLPEGGSAELAPAASLANLSGGTHFITSTAAQVRDAINAEGASYNLVRASVPEPPGTGIAVVSNMLSLEGGYTLVYPIRIVYRSAFGDSLASEEVMRSVRETQEGRSIQVRPRRRVRGAEEWYPVIQLADGQWYKVYDPETGGPGAGYAFGKASHIFTDDPEGWPRANGRPVISAVTQMELPTEDASGLGAPDINPEAVSVFGEAYPPAGAYWGRMSLASRDGGESRVSGHSQVVITDTQMVVATFSNATNLIRNAEVTENDSRGEPLHHKIVRNSGFYRTEPGRVRLNADITGGLTDAQTPYHETVSDDGSASGDPYLAVDPARDYIARVRLQAPVYYRGRGRCLLRQYRADKSFITSTTVGEMTATGDKVFTLPFGAGQSVTLANDCAFVSFRHAIQVASGETTARMILYASMMAIHPPSIPAIRKVSLPEDPSDPVDSDYRNFLSESYPEEAVAGVMLPPPAEGNNPDRPQNADATYRSTDPDGNPIYQAYYFALPTQPASNGVYLGGYRQAVMPGETYTASLFHRYSKVTTNARMVITAHLENGRVIELASLLPGVGGTIANPVSRGWAEDVTDPFVIPGGCYEIRISSRNVGGGEFVCQEPCISLGAEVVRGYGRQINGSLRAILDTETPKLSPYDTPLGRRWLSAMLEPEIEPDTTALTTRYRSTDDETFVEASFSTFETDFSLVPEARYLDSYADFQGDGRNTHVLSSGSPGLLKGAAFSVLLRDDRSEYDGGVIVSGLPTYSAPREYAVAAAEDIRITPTSLPRGTMPEFDIFARTETAKTEIEETWADGPVIIEGGSKVMEIQMLEPPVFEQGEGTALRYNGEWYDAWAARISNVRVLGAVTDERFTTR